MKTFVRTEPPDTQVTKSVIALLLHYGWNKFSIVTERAWSTVARSLQQQAAKNNLTVNHYKTVEDRHTCCEERLPCCQVSVWFQLIQETKNMTRSQSIFLYFYAGLRDAIAETFHRSKIEKLRSNMSLLNSIYEFSDRLLEPGFRRFQPQIHLCAYRL